MVEQRRRFLVARGHGPSLTSAALNPKEKLDLQRVNAMSAAEFEAVFGAVFEHSPWVAKQASADRPFASVEELHARMGETVRDARPEQQLALIRAHPDLVGRAALTPESQGEQSAAGLMDLSAGEREQFARYNAEYKERFGFPFVICARLNKKEAILEAFPRRLQNSPDEERATALREIDQIAELRLRDLLFL